MSVKKFVASTALNNSNQTYNNHLRNESKYQPLHYVSWL